MPGFDPFGTFRKSTEDGAAQAAASAPGGATGAAARGRPATGRTLPWHKRREWKRTGRQLFRWYSKRSDFRFVFKPGQKEPLARVMPGRKRVEVTTAFPEAEGHADFRVGPSAPAGGPAAAAVRHAQMLQARPTEVWLRGLTAHEAGHVLFSGEKPEEAALGWLWNALEDERMERLVAARYQKHGRLEAIFETMGDVMLMETGEERSGRLEAKREAERRQNAGEDARPMTVLNSCLLWRWLEGHAPSGAGYHPYLPLPEERFADARPLIEEAWSAKTSERVTECARKILNAFGIPEGADVPDDALEDFDLSGGAIPGGGPAEGTAGDGEPGNREPKGGDPAKGDPENGAEGDAEPSGSNNPHPDEPKSAPEVPGIDPESELAERAADLLDGQQADARKLAEALRPEAKRRTARTPSRSRGRFEYRRYARGAERVFSQRPERAQPPAFITVLLDMSGSMAGPSRPDEDAGATLFEQAQRCVALLSGAAELAGTHLRVIPFTTEAARPISSRDPGSHEMLRMAVASAAPQGRTKLAPALRAAFSGEGLDAAGGRHIVTLISDGELESQDARVCQRVYQRARRGSANASGAPLVLPLLLGAATSDEDRAGRSGGPTPEDVYELVFRRHAAIEDASELPAAAARWIKHAA